jgi:segregation and condensation protein B
MPPSADPPFDPKKQGISLDELTEAFAKAMGVEPRPSAEPRETTDAGEPASGEKSETGEAPAAQLNAPAAPDLCPISPQTILEAMLFVGNAGNQPLSAARAAELMRDVGAEELRGLVEQMNRRYAADDAPYQIIAEGDGYRMALREEFRGLRDRFYGRIREAKLSQAAVDVLSLVAYQQSITSEKVSRLRGKPSSHLLTQLVRRGLLRIERTAKKSHTPHYFTTARFLQLFNLASLDDLPQGEDPEPK